MIALPEITDLVAPGRVTARSARLWFRSARPGPLEVFVWPADAQGSERGFPIQHVWESARDGTGACSYPQEFPGAPALVPGRQYRFRIVRAGEGGGERLGEGRFETAPDLRAARTTFSFALMSCHQPFLEDGRIAPEAAAMLAALGPALDRRGVKYVLLLGDQIYADEPGTYSVFAARGQPPERPERWPSLPQIRAAYQRRYRQAWHTPMGALLAQRPSFIVLDDHDVYDAWGSLPVHQTEPWVALRTGALEAAFDYQLGRNLPEARRAGPYWRWFRWGHTATFLADDRSERRARRRGAGTALSDAQFAGLSAFLDRHRDCGVLFLAFSVPLVFLPDWFTRVGAAVTGSHPGALDRWSFVGWQHQRDRILELLLRQRERCPGQQLVLLSGDIHEALALALKSGDGVRPIYQFVSSPVTNTHDGVLQAVAHTASRMLRSVHAPRGRLTVELLPGSAGARRNPYTALNVGIVEVDTSSWADREPPRLRFEVLAPDHRASDLGVVFDSGPL